MIFNCNAITKHADETQTVDETTWGHAGYGESGSGLVTRLLNKKVNKGGQTTLMSDSKRFRPRAYIHRHKLHVPQAGMTRRGTIELVALLLEIQKMVLPQDPLENTTDLTRLFTNTDSPNLTTTSVSTPVDNTKKIFRRKPTVCADNFFFDDKMCEWIGKNGFGSLGTNARNALPKGIEKKYLHGEKHVAGCKISKVARFTNPIVAVKDAGGFQRVHISFQSTNATNITSVNCFNSVKLFVEIRERGKGVRKRVWGIEMNDGRRLYLSTYFRIDVADHLLKNAAIFYRTWKYWHAPKNHCLALVIVLSYDIYLECAEGKIRSEWFIPEKKRKSFFHFRHLLSQQMLTYSPKQLKYPGDERMRAVTGITRVQRGSRKKLGQVSLEQVRAAKKTGSICGDIQKLCKHTSSIVRNNHANVCAWCGEGGAYTHCGECMARGGKKISLHYNCKAGPGKGLYCFYHYHDDSCFGLGKNDTSQLLNQPKWDWKTPTKRAVKENQTYVRNLSK